MNSSLLSESKLGNKNNFVMNSNRSIKNNLTFNQYLNSKTETKNNKLDKKEKYLNKSKNSYTSDTIEKN